MLFLAVLASTVIYAQNTTVRQQVWLGIVKQWHIQGKWGIWLDMQYRTQDDFYSKISTVAGRTGIVYRCSPKLRMVGGYAYFRIVPLSGNMPVPHEHRGWQMLQWTHQTPRVRLIQAFRAEQRFRERIIQNQHTHQYTFNHRFRYNINVTFPFKTSKAFQPNSLAYTLGNEIMYNAGKEIIWNTFDQNRIWVGLQYHTNQKIAIQILYMYLYQHLSQPKQRLISHHIRLTFT